MAATMLAAPRYGVEDFETMSIRSAAPSYRSDAPSYHSADYRSEPTPAYTPSNAAAAGSDSRQSPNSFSLVRLAETQHRQQQTIGLPPLPPLAAGSMNMNSYRLPTWSTHNAPAARQYNSVVERRVNAERERSRGSGVQERPRAVTLDRSPDEGPSNRPLEDPYLVGEQAAAQARRERLLRENGDDILIREDQQWDWLLAEMRNWESREKSWAKFRREVETGQRKNLLRRIGGRMI